MKKNVYFGIIAALGMVLLILDTRTAIAGASQGLEICIKTVIPSLFPFFFLSKIITSSADSFSGKIFRPIGKLCRIPEGSEIILLLGLLGGYPIGAQMIENAVSKGSISPKDGNRMLGFCNNPGPAFIFGMTGCLFDAPYAPWILWGIVILSTLLTGIFLPGSSEKFSGTISLPKDNYMTSALKSMATVCGWIILFRVLLNILSRWALWLFPVPLQILISGILELSNGCLALNALPNQASRFILATVILCGGGFCVAMQTVSVSPSLQHRKYFIGKAVQVFIVIPLSLVCAVIFFGATVKATNILLFAVCILLLIAILNASKIIPSVHRNLDKYIRL